MEILSDKNLTEIVERLQAGEVLVLPSETSYGLVCDSSDQAAVDKIFTIKDREKTKSLLVVVPSISMAKEYLEWNDLMEMIATKFWPGPLTIVNKARGESGLAIGVISNEGTLAIRVTAHNLLKNISERLGKPLVSTSANISGQTELYDPILIQQMFAEQVNRPDAILDAGLLPVEKPTTVISVLNNELKVLRQGKLQITLS